MVRIPALVAAVALAFSQLPAAADATPARTATAQVREIFVEANRALTDPATEDSPGERVLALLELLDRVVAFGEAAELALGREWRARSAADQAEFLTLFTEMVERALVMTVASRMKLERGVEIRYVKESINGRHAAVTVMIVGRDGNDIPVEFRMVRRADTWAIRDVALDSVSFMGAYRAQFTRVLRMSSYPELIARMKARNIDVPDWWAAIRPNGHRPGTHVARNGTPAAQPPKPPATTPERAIARTVTNGTTPPPVVTATGEAPNGASARTVASADDFPPPAPELIAAAALRAHAELAANATTPAAKAPVADAPRPAPPVTASSADMSPETPHPTAPATRRSTTSRSREVASARPESPGVSSPALSPPALSPPARPVLAAPTLSPPAAFSPARPPLPGPALSPPPAPPAMTPPPAGERPASLASSRPPERRLAALPTPQRPPISEIATGASRRRAGVAYWVQVGLFENQKTVMRLLEELLVRKLPVEIGPMQLRTSRGEVAVTRVRVGPYPDRAAAAATLGELKRSGYAPILGTEPPAPPAPAR